jgi:hypothetical protein
MLMQALIPQWLYLLLINLDRNNPEKIVHKIFTQMGKKQMYLEQYTQIKSSNQIGMDSTTLIVSWSWMLSLVMFFQIDLREILMKDGVSLEVAGKCWRTWITWQAEDRNIEMNMA